MSHSCLETPEKEILWAAGYGEVETVECLLKANPDLVHVHDSDGYTPLHRACYENHVTIAKILLENNANVSACTNEHWTPLHSACRWNSGECAALLLDWGANANAITHGGLTALHLAASHSAYESLWLLLTHPLTDTTIQNTTKETAQDIAQRNTPYSRIFEVAHKSVNYL